MQKLFNYCFELEFYFKIAISCTIVQQVFYFLFNNIELNFITQLCAWTLIGNIYNLEGHSSLSLFFIPSDFHDLHHTSFNGNYGIQSFWDRVFKTLTPITKNRGIMFPVSLIESSIINLYITAKQTTNNNKFDD